MEDCHYHGSVSPQLVPKCRHESYGLELEPNPCSNKCREQSETLEEDYSRLAASQTWVWTGCRSSLPPPARRTSLPDDAGPIQLYRFFPKFTASTRYIRRRRVLFTIYSRRGRTGRTSLVTYRQICSPPASNPTIQVV